MSQKNETLSASSLSLVIQRQAREVKTNIDHHLFPPIVYESLMLPAAPEKKFRLLTLLRHSLSLDYDEKMRVINEMPELTLFQIDELCKVLKGEHKKWELLLLEELEEILKDYHHKETIYHDLHYIAENCQNE